jgi:hypothetical protein
LCAEVLHPKALKRGTNLQFSVAQTGWFAKRTVRGAIPSYLLLTLKVVQ